MVAPSHYRITWTGTLGTATAGEEEFSFGLSFGPVGTWEQGTAAPSVLKSLADELGPAVNALQLSMTNQVRVRECTVALRSDVGGRLVTPRTVDGQYRQGKHLFATPVGGSGAGNTPLQVALAVSTESQASGAVGRGRFYIPCPPLGTLDVDGRMTDAVRDAHAGRAATFLNNINTILAGRDITLRLVVASGGSPSQGIAPSLYPIVRVGVGRVLDTQRRRRNDLDESKEFTTLA